MSHFLQLHMNLKSSQIKYSIFRNEGKIKRHSWIVFVCACVSAWEREKEEKERERVGSGGGAFVSSRNALLNIKGWKHLGWKQVIPESNSNPHEKIEALVKVISGAFKRHYNCIFLLSTD